MITRPHNSLEDIITIMNMQIITSHLKVAVAAVPYSPEDKKNPLKTRKTGAALQKTKACLQWFVHFSLECSQPHAVRF